MEHNLAIVVQPRRYQALARGSLGDYYMRRGYQECRRR